MEEGMKETLKKIEELKSEINDYKLQCGEKEKNILKKLEILSSRIDFLTKVVNEKYHTNDNLLTYIVGAFAGGLIMGLSFYKRTKG